MHDVIVIGHGPAGISTAIYLKRSNVDVVVIGKDLGALDGYVDVIENYYGFAKPIPGEALIKNGIQQAENLGIEMIKDDVIALIDLGEGFQVKTTKRHIESKTVVLATGKTRTKLNMPGFNTYLGKGISMCATCDGYFYRKKSIAVIGNGPYMAHELSVLKRLSEHITVFTNGKQLETQVDVPVVTTPLQSFKGTTRITHIETIDAKLHTADGVFIAIGAPSSLEFASQLGVIVEKGHVIVDEKHMTNVPGLFAAGDIIGGKLQIAKAVHDGLNTADAIVSYLK